MAGPTRFDSVIQLQLGNLLVKDGRYEEAVEALRRARRDAPPEVATGASAVLVTALLRMGDFESAFVEAEALATSAPRSADALATYADALWALGRFEESARAVKDALAHITYWKAAVVREARGKRLAWVQAELEAAKADTAFADLYLQRARELMSTELTEAQYATLEGLDREVASLTSHIGAAVEEYLRAVTTPADPEGLFRVVLEDEPVGVRLVRLVRSPIQPRSGAENM